MRYNYTVLQESFLCAVWMNLDTGMSQLPPLFRTKSTQLSPKKKTAKGRAALHFQTRTVEKHFHFQPLPNAPENPRPTTTPRRLLCGGGCLRLPVTEARDPRGAAVPKRPRRSWAPPSGGHKPRRRRCARASGRAGSSQCSSHPSAPGVRCKGCEDEPKT